MKQNAQTTRQDCPISVGIGKISIPSYLDKPQIVTLISDNEIAQDEFNRWAESIEECISRVLHEEISQKCDQIKIMTFPFDKHLELDYKVKLDVHDFLPNETKKTITLFCYWRITDKNRNMIIRRNSAIVVNYNQDEQQPDDKYTYIVSGMEQAVIQLSTEISEAISAITSEKQ
ncbi:MAG: PqiC family protein [Puniceicoccales bacterium]|nr:PqiC family protein [Puniceicoccales bacterium]